MKTNYSQSASLIKYVVLHAIETHGWNVRVCLFTSTKSIIKFRATMFFDNDDIGLRISAPDKRYFAVKK